ncbi:hypothetical protein F4778DRAFT_378517 [Xylariomycetidae sp. FL2044]|nr:hypothetical protein F4778DRAFT_378517 [Xylariomycetidae sp. FL2044]
MTSLFQGLESQGLQDYEKPMYEVLKATLGYPTTPDVLAHRLSDDIIFFCMSASGTNDDNDVVTNAWNLIFDMISYIPSDHEWQDVWVNALQDLSGRGDLPPMNGYVKKFSWKELPGFSLQQRESHDKLQGEDGERWKNLVSFYARLCVSGLAGPEMYSIWALRDATEEYDSGAEVWEPVLWVAIEWVIRCADAILAHMAESREVNTEWERRALSLGSAVADKEGVGLVSMERWNLWKEWFSARKEKLLADGGEAATIARISEALDKMKEAEEKAKRDASTQDTTN